MAEHRRSVGGKALEAALAAAAFLWSDAALADPLDRWTSEIARASARFAIPEAWIRRVIRIESGGEALLDGQPVVSRAGAMGLMQLMPGTWSDMRSKLGLGADPFDPADNVLAGTAYLRLMYDRFGYPGLFAAYNAGPARYAGFLSGTRRLPAETRSYVAAVAPVMLPQSATPRRTASGLFALKAGTGGGPGQQSSPVPLASLFVAFGGAPR